MIINNSIFHIPIVNNVILYDETDSTNNRAKEFGDNGCVDGTLIISDTQTSGKGRLGRSFSSPAGTGIYMSLLLRPQLAMSGISRITLLAAMAVHKALDKIPEISSQIKWPNDIVVDGKKVVGILTEASWDTSLRYVVIGIGINVNNDVFPEDISPTAISLYQICGKKLEREKIIFDVMKNLSEYYHNFMLNKGLSFMIEEYNRSLISFNQKVYLIPHDMTASTVNPYQFDTTGIKPCTCLGIDENGDLICRHADGAIEIVNSGEVSVRGIHGYSQ